MMDIYEAMKRRHSIRKYLRKPIEEEKVLALREFISSLSEESGLRIELVTNDPDAFSGKLAHYGSFEGCENYFLIIADKKRDEDVGYFGEKLVLFSEQIGLNTCWVALTYNKTSVKTRLEKGERVAIVISVGYGKFRGLPHKNRPLDRLCTTDGTPPDWFSKGMEAALLAPTAMNQQKFHFTLIGENTVRAKALAGPYSKMDLGIVKYHFELGAGKENFTWEKRK